MDLRAAWRIVVSPNGGRCRQCGQSSAAGEQLALVAGVGGVKLPRLPGSLMRERARAIINPAETTRDTTTISTKLTNPEQRSNAARAEWRPW